jgi:hypothetical protein
MAKEPRKLRCSFVVCCLVLLLHSHHGTQSLQKFGDNIGNTDTNCRVGRTSCYDDQVFYKAEWHR